MPDAAELNTGRRRCWPSCATAAVARRAPISRCGGTTRHADHRPDAAARFGIQPQDRRHAVRRIRAAAGHAVLHQVNSYYVILEVPPECRASLGTLDKLYVKSASGALVPLSTFVQDRHAPVQPLSVNHQSQFPSVTISFNLHQGAALGDAVNAIHAAQAQLGAPASLRARSRARRRRSSPRSPRALPDRGRAGRGLHHPRHPVRELHPAADDPVHAALGRRRRAADAADRAGTTCR